MKIYYNFFASWWIFFLLSKLGLYLPYEQLLIENKIFKTFIKFLRFKAFHRQYKFAYSVRDIPPKQFFLSSVIHLIFIFTVASSNFGKSIAQFVWYFRMVNVLTCSSVLFFVFTCFLLWIFSCCQVLVVTSFIPFRFWGWLDLGGDTRQIDPSWMDAGVVSSALSPGQWFRKYRFTSSALSTEFSS